MIPYNMYSFTRAIKYFVILSYTRTVNIYIYICKGANRGRRVGEAGSARGNEPVRGTCVT